MTDEPDYDETLMECDYCNLYGERDMEVHRCEKDSVHYCDTCRGAHADEYHEGNGEAFGN